MEARSGGCDPTASSCDAARNLQLHIRWKKEQIRRPFVKLKDLFCDRLLDTQSTFVEGLRHDDAERDLFEEIRKLNCLAQPAFRERLCGELSTKGSGLFSHAIDLNKIPVVLRREFDCPGGE